MCHQLGIFLPRVDSFKCESTHGNSSVYSAQAEEHTKVREKAATGPIFSMGLLHDWILITSGALVSTEQNQTTTLKHTHTHARMQAHTPQISHPQRP